MCAVAHQSADVDDECHRRMHEEPRRRWTIPIAVVGWLILSGLAVALWRHASPEREHAEAV